ncbi:MBOAT family protein [Paraglaciecola sp. 20A4]|uniref:MBOAT family O-acyltransferase n=1 Tax=Paraglaciecola sp. 20A4 TaxID=2687288 RepID=UPI00140E754C|nr:MBOAT family protein [Paraglaciecola sp. 20A4]
MLFNSHEFIFLFLPLCLCGYFLISKLGARAAISFLVLASLGFYAWWKAEYLVLIIISILFNFGWARCIDVVNRRYQKWAKFTLGIGVTLNLIALCYYKYTNFLVDQFNWLANTDYFVAKIALPLAISFFTFQQIAYLVDTYRKEINEHSFLRYCLFVTFFPQLIAGPIVHHKEMLPQFERNETFKPHALNFALGLTLFSIGIFKKVVFADNAAIFATPVFNAADAGSSVTFIEAWLGTSAYTLQLYFDFSGYTDMALGLAMLFGIRLPDNFNSPYKSHSIVDFWRRWHITLSRFLRDYLYISLGGNRKGKSRRYVNLMATMVLGGIWHGAGWNFMIWGFLHGSYLVVNHWWTATRARFFATPIGKIENAAYWALTMLAVMVAWVFFRAETTEGAFNIFNAMAAVDLNEPFKGTLFYTTKAIVVCTLLFIIAIFCPNSGQLTRYVEERLTQPPVDKPWLTFGPAMVSAVGFVISVGLIGQLSEFLYFNF